MHEHIYSQDVANCWPISWPEFAKEKIQPRRVGQSRQTRYRVGQILAYFNRYELDGISAERKLYKIESLLLPKNEFARREAKPAAVPQALARAHVPAAPSAVAAAHILKKAGLLGAADRGAQRPRGGQHARLSPAPLTRRPPPRLQDIDLRQCGTVKSADDLTNKPFSFTVQVELATPASADASHSLRIQVFLVASVAINRVLKP